ncbi:hypothetical protein Q2T41_18460 [Maribacter confluentis]|uniref:Uncharacterized protein n=2 Tax=Maribacter TaxID=252356 RepID=A0ABY1SHC7_9FLAO|nr:MULTISPECIES: hypothetical protein [Maribacter]MDO1514640.1 hypothetical protein [Maribacter confluentis]TVZ14134.1 hypothetical protein JM81_0335 [Maribacter sp. MAR_2009_72]SNR48261.1 hypothetical protein SAMN04488009_2102 [Maribacter sedimenticola]
MSILKNKKYKQLLMGLLFDGIGMLSFAIPFVGEFSDIVWAPLSGWLMTRMYKGKVGQAAGIFTFVEEIIPGFDIIPSFTLMWLYTYVFKSEEKGKTIEV